MTKIIKKYFLHEKILAIALIFTAAIQIVTLLTFISMNQKMILKIDTDSVIATLIKQSSLEDLPEEQIKEKIKHKIKKLDESLDKIAQKNNGFVINSKAVVAGGVDITQEVLKNLQEDK